MAHHVFQRPRSKAGRIVSRASALLAPVVIGASVAVCLLGEPPRGFAIAMVYITIHLWVDRMIHRRC